MVCRLHSSINCSFSRILTPSPNSVPSGNTTATRPRDFKRRMISARNRSAVSRVRKCAGKGALHLRLVLGAFHIALAHMIDGASEEAAGAACGIEQDFAGVRIYAVGHEGGNRAGCVIFARVAG